MLPFVCGFIGMAFLGFFHNVCLTFIARCVNRNQKSHYFLAFYIFSCLALIHMAEICLYAGYLAFLENTFWAGAADLHFAGTAYDWIYFSRINYTTLGYTEMKVEGPFRIVSMMYSLAGFMLITWSATFLYSACGRYWKQET